jgi:SH3-like domain-containing protein
LSKHNYTQYSKKSNAETEVVDLTDLIDETVEIKMEPEINIVEETVETVTLPESVPGIVVDCAKLNIRVAPQATADIVCVINAASEIEINIAESTDEWFHICTATGVEGYCMRKFVKASL